MTTPDSKPIIFIDTSFLKGVSWKDPDWQLLLEESKQANIQIVIPELVLKERCSQWRDEIIQKARRVKESIDTLIDTWDKSPTTGYSRLYENPHFIANISIESFEKDIDSKVSAYSSKLVSDNRLYVLSKQPHHTEGAFTRYFDWKPPFNNPLNSEKGVENREDAKTRTARKEHFPDAWILEAALDFSETTANFYVLCRDKRLNNSFKNELGIQTYDNAREVLDAIEQKDKEQTPSLQDIPEFKDSHENNSDGSLIQLFNLELFQRVLGYIYWLEGENAVSKDTLIERLKQKYGYTSEQIRSTADYLSHVSKVIEDTGNYYIAVDIKICKDAADEVLSDVLSLLDED
ncbi:MULTISPECIES: PIN domain-containing protein [Pseudanabaena]|jgi:rRNA-processing protein FCF1|uniref:PIN domain-containing protein n=1 Tax=Pseudanabaena TaxID=1152 RepID=UPI0024788097|nr:MULTISPECIES: PIN domain-containing protein [Pseudanabaena]MEA5488166.1 PIN domain-containing protein [Pseudanabaena sp. CCNP1317]WGS75393.1 PIN domain-containing protein [Pseudanabaena galeata CCNP1313]